MTIGLLDLIAIFGCYLIGAIPFGVIVARAHGVDIFKAGSGNIGATNVGRVIGWKWGALVFVLDFLKGAVPALMIIVWKGRTDAVALLGGLAAVIGHIFPVYLRFRGGKGVAAAAGALTVLLPMPILAAVIAFAATVVASRTISFASVCAAIALVISQLSLKPDVISLEAIIAALAAFMVIFRHRSNIVRIRGGTELQVAGLARYESYVPGLHALAIGLWCGAAWFFTFGVAGKIFTTFNHEVNGPPGWLVVSGDPAAFASRLAGTAVAPLFPNYFMVQAICGLIAAGIAAGWCIHWHGYRHRLRAWLLIFCLLMVAIGWPISQKVSRLRIERYSNDVMVQKNAHAVFPRWHLISLMVNLLVLAGTAPALALAAYPPRAKVVPKLDSPTTL